MYISIIIPCYNTNKEHFLQLSKSLIAVKDKIEVIVIDDSTSNPVNEYFDDFFSEFKRKTYLKNERNMGLSYSYNKGIEVSTGDIICTLDHDDVAQIDNIIDNIIDLFKQGYNFVYTNEYKFEDSRIENYKKPDLDILSVIYYFYPHHFTFYLGSIAREIIKDKPCYNIFSAFDIWFYLNYIAMLNKSLKYKHIDVEAYGWRVHDGSTAKSINQKPAHIIDRINIAEEFFSKFNSHGYFSVKKETPFILDAIFTDKIEEINNTPLSNKKKNLLTRIPFNYLKHMGVLEFSINVISERDIGTLPKELAENITKHLNVNLPFIFDGKIESLETIAYVFNGKLSCSEINSNLNKHIVVVEK